MKLFFYRAFVFEKLSMKNISCANIFIICAYIKFIKFLVKQSLIYLSDNKEQKAVFSFVINILRISCGHKSANEYCCKVQLLFLHLIYRQYFLRYLNLFRVTVYFFTSFFLTFCKYSNEKSVINFHIICFSKQERNLFNNSACEQNLSC